MKTSVSVTRRESRCEIISSALQLICDDIADAVKGKRVLVKPNLVSVRRQLAATHVNTMRAVLDFLFKLEPSEVLICEGSAEDTWEGFRRYGYLALRDEYGVELVDLNRDEYVELPIFDRYLGETTIRVSRTVYEADYRVSAAVMKTHDCVVVTLSLKNMVMGSIVGGYSHKSKMHQGYPAINLNLYRLARLIPVQLAVVDGNTAMEGRGPVSGEPVELRVALAGTDFIAVDATAARIMGFNPEEIGYLYYAWKYGLGTIDPTEIEIVGEPLSRVKTQLKPHPKYEEQLGWHIPKCKLKHLEALWERYHG